VIEKYAKTYLASNRNIPTTIYAVFGEGDRELQNTNMQSWKKPLTSNTGTYANLILVEYVGRLAGETFPDDLEDMFQWMQYQRRRLPDRAGFEFEVDSLRPWDNYYYFLQLNGFPRENVMWPQLWKDGKLNALPISGELKPEGPKYHHFIVKPSRAGQSMTLWLSDDFVNFEEKEIRITGRGEFRQSVKPSTRIMLEDVRSRADRLHPYWARVDCNVGKWQVVE
jgi:hypothetical protein